MILAWGEVEANINVTLLAEFGLLTLASSPSSAPGKDRLSFEAWMRFFDVRTNPKEIQQIHLLLDLPLNKKIDFLRKVGAINKEEFSTLRQFQRDRNNSFHGVILGSSALYLSKEDKISIMNHGVEASEVSSEIAMRSIRSMAESQDIALFLSSESLETEEILR
jgi:hypothetical protein